MSPAAVVTVVLALLTVVVLAAFLIYIAILLLGVTRRLNAIAGGVPVITAKAEPAGPVVNEINQDLAGVYNALLGVLTKSRPPKRKPEPPAQQPVRTSAGPPPARTSTGPQRVRTSPTGPGRTGPRP
jgi:hypothetical protein